RLGDVEGDPPVRSKVRLHLAVRRGVLGEEIDPIRYAGRRAERAAEGLAEAVIVAAMPPSLSPRVIGARLERRVDVIVAQVRVDPVDRVVDALRRGVS